MQRLNLQSKASVDAPLVSGNIGAMTFGNFDGVHLGHQQLIEQVIHVAQKTGGLSLVMSFEPHPVKVLAPDSGFKKLFPVEANARFLEELGVDIFVTLEFDRGVAGTEPLEFLANYIVKPFAPQALVMGYDLRFGKARGGDIRFAQERSSELGFDVEEAEALKVAGNVVSSSRIREQLNLGNISECNKLLGRTYSVIGRVIKGDQRGRKLGFPTANIDSSEYELVPKPGVYETSVVVSGNSYRSVTNIGLRPTFKKDQEQPNIETHILDFNEELYDQKLEVFFHRRIRDEINFESKDQLVEQIKKDIQGVGE